MISRDLVTPKNKVLVDRNLDINIGWLAIAIPHYNNISNKNMQNLFEAIGKKITGVELNAAEQLKHMTFRYPAVSEYYLIRCTKYFTVSSIAFLNQRLSAIYTIF